MVNDPEKGAGEMGGGGLEAPDEAPERKAGSDAPDKKEGGMEKEGGLPEERPNQ
jgi:hypothetical protein